MTRLFQDSREPLLGRLDHRINLQPLKPPYLAKLLHDQQRFSAENLLTWFTLSGGVPKYLEWLIRADPQQNLWQELINENSLVLEEGRYRSTVEIQNFSFIRRHCLQK